MSELLACLCAGTALLCAALLMRAYARNRTRLLLWSAVCFVGLAASNVLLVFDRFTGPAVDLSLPRALLSLAAIGSILAGLVWEER